jgi:N-acetylmuramoyl-L-alanine amidase
LIGFLVGRLAGDRMAEKRRSMLIWPCRQIVFWLTKLALSAKISRTTMRSAAWLRAPVIILLLQSQLAFGATCATKAAEDIVIVLDVGHIARKPGGQCQRFVDCPWGQTSARGVPEYDFNIKLARRVKEELVRAGFRSTYLMVTQVDAPGGLYQRANRANDMNADIFISLHHDGVSDSFLREWKYQGEQHFFFDEAKGFSLHVSPRYAESLRLAQLLADQLMGSGLDFNRVHEPSNPAGAKVPYLDSKRGIYKRNNLVVLSQTQMPAVLLESGVIVNRDEELVVATPAFQATVAAAILEAVRTFCNPRGRSKIDQGSLWRAVRISQRGQHLDLSIVGRELAIHSYRNLGLSRTGRVPAFVAETAIPRARS